MITEAQILNMLFNKQTQLPTVLSVEMLQGKQSLSKKTYLDAAIKIVWGKSSAKFIAEIKPISTPKVFANAIGLLQSIQLPSNYLPLLIMPYLNETQLNKLIQIGISGFDLSGNCAISVPNQFTFYKTGKKNAFPSSARIKNVYRKNSSMVTRVFFTRSQYTRVGDVCNEINNRNLLVKIGIKKAMSLSTASKTLIALDKDLIIRRNSFISFLQPEKALSKLTANYQPPKIDKAIKLKVRNLSETIYNINAKAEADKLAFVATGLSSSTQFAVADRGEMLSAYCTNLKLVLNYIDGDHDDNFPNLELIETQDERVYFNSYIAEGYRWASSIQTYLELMDGDKRDRETAEQVKEFILRR